MPPRIFLPLLLIVSFVSSAVFAEDYKYQQPVNTAHLIDNTKISLPVFSKNLTATDLTNAAKIIAADLNDGKKNDPLLPSKCLALALDLEPENKSAVVTNFQLSQGSMPAAPANAQSLKNYSDRFLQLANRLSSGQNDEDKKLAGYLLEIAASLDPLNEDAIYQMATGTKADWSAKLPDSNAIAQTQPTPAPSVTITNANVTTTPSTEIKARSSIKILLVNIGTQQIGLTNNLIGTLQSTSQGSDLNLTFSGSVGSQMDTAAKEATRLTKLKHPNLAANYNVMLSFEDKYTPKDGGSCGTAVTVLLLSLLDNFDIDQKAVITGDITVDGQVQKIGGVFSKTEGALAAKASYMVLPKQNASDLEDYLVLHPLTDLLKIQIFTADNIDEALTLMKQEKSPDFTQASELYSTIASKLQAQGINSGLRNQEILGQLQEVLKLTPNHLSARLLLRAAAGTLPQKMSAQNSIDQIFLAAAPFLPELFANSDKNYSTTQITFRPYSPEICDLAAKQISSLNFKVDKQTAALQDAMLSYIQAWQTLSGLQAGQSYYGGSHASQMQPMLDARAKIFSEVNSLKYDKSYLENFLRKDK